MRLEVADWEFEIDMAATMEFSASEAAEHCQCAYCRNFYAVADTAFPDLRSFLAQFGIDIEAPDELMPFEATNIMNLYAVSGRILKKGPDMHINGVTVYAETAEEAMMNTACPGPYFVLSVGPMNIPWVLDEPVDAVESTANLPSFLNKMRSFILRIMGKSEQLSQ